MDPDLERAGFSREVLDALQPIIEITEWYCARGDRGSIFNLRVDLLDDTCKHTNELNRSFFFPPKKQHNGKEVLGTRCNISSKITGKASDTWAGHYGSKMAGVRVRIVF